MLKLSRETAPVGDDLAAWLQTPEGKAAIAEAMRQAQIACDELADARKVDPAIMNIPIGAAAPVGDDAELVRDVLACTDQIGRDLHNNDVVRLTLQRAAARIAELERERDELRAELDAMQRDSLRKAAINVALLSKLAAERERRE